MVDLGHHLVKISEFNNLLTQKMANSASLKNPRRITPNPRRDKRVFESQFLLKGTSYRPTFFNNFYYHLSSFDRNQNIGWDEI